MKNNLHLIQAFPERSIHTCLVNMSQVKDYQKYKADRKENPDLVTTPFHLACKLSNDEAVRQLVDQHSYDINILVNVKSGIYELLSTSCYLDFNILNYLMKKRRPCINSGKKLPLNQAILRGNPFIIKSLLEFGRPHPCLRDANGKAPIHVAATKLDLETFEHLIEQTGVNPMIPDSDGNTILHLIALGVIRDAEYDFVKTAIIKYGLRLTRNADNRTPLTIIRSYSSQPAPRGQPNFRKKLWEYFE